MLGFKLIHVSKGNQASEEERAATDPCPYFFCSALIHFWLFCARVQLKHTINICDDVSILIGCFHNIINVSVLCKYFIKLRRVISSLLV